MEMLVDDHGYGRVLLDWIAVSLVLTTGVAFLFVDFPLLKVLGMTLSFYIFG